MTRQMADDEVLRVLDFPPVMIDPVELREARAAVAALQAERDALLADVDKYRVPWQEYDERTEWVQHIAKPKELGMHRADVLRLRIEHAEQRAERAESALEALRGQVAGLVNKWQAESNALPTLSHKGAGLDRGIKELSELLAIKESDNAPQA